MRSLQVLCSLTVAVLLLPAMAVAQQGQLRFLNRDRELKVESGVTILNETLESVTYRRGTSTREVPSLDILELSYGEGSESFQQGLKALAESQWNNAVNLLARAAGESKPVWMPAVAQLHQAEAESLRPDGAAAAIKTLDAFIAGHDDHRRLPQALLMRARLAGVTGNIAVAKADTARVRQMAQSREVNADWTVEAGLVLGDALLAAEDVRAAREAYADAERGAGLAKGDLAERPDLIQRVDQLALNARVGVGSCMLASDDISGARNYYSQLLRDNPGQAAVAAAAGNGLAECDFRAGGKLKEAQLGFARVAVTAAATPEEHARALYYLGRCADELGSENAEPDGRRKALAYYDIVQQNFPNSPWARLAAQANP